MNIEKNHVVSLTYQLFDNQSNELVEEVKADNPLTFIFGTGNLLPKFEDNLQSLKAGDPFEFVLNHTEAYGDVQENAVVELNKSIFMVDGKVNEELVKLGHVIPMKDSQGRRMDGRVIAITDDMVKMDFNHPMAGKDLNFKGSVESVREATEDELKNGLYGSSCGCGEGSCDTEDCGDHSGSCGC